MFVCVGGGGGMGEGAHALCNLILHSPSVLLMLFCYCCFVFWLVVFLMVVHVTVYLSIFLLSLHGFCC